jgi:hypothetical protein
VHLEGIPRRVYCRQVRWTLFYHLLWCMVQPNLVLLVVIDQRMVLFSQVIC